MCLSPLFAAPGHATDVEPGTPTGAGTEPAFRSAPRLGTASDLADLAPRELAARARTLTARERAAIANEMAAAARQAEAITRARTPPSPRTEQSTNSPIEVKLRADEWMFEEALDSFIDFRASNYTLAPYEWSSDGCSTPRFGSVRLAPAYAAKFIDACVRHDFGYRNYGRKTELRLSLVGDDATSPGQAYESERKKIDAQFLTDMNQRASTFVDRQAAYVFWRSVRLLGKPAF